MMLSILAGGLSAETLAFPLDSAVSSIALRRTKTGMRFFCFLFSLQTIRNSHRKVSSCSNSSGSLTFFRLRPGNGDLSKSVLKFPEEARSCCDSERVFFLPLTEQEEGSYGSYPIEQHQRCTTYDFRVRCACNQGWTSDWSEILPVQDKENREHSICCEHGNGMRFQKLGLIAIFYIA